MAIKRCPYCRSIIDEIDRYCNSCGTQLLFPEDENVEEDIPGERIVEAEDKLPEEDIDISAREEELEPEPLSAPPPAEDELPVLPSKSKKETVIPDLEFPAEAPVPPPSPPDDIPWKFSTRDLPEMSHEPPSPPAPAKTGRFETRPEKDKPAEEFEAGFPTSAEESDEIARLMAALEKQAPPRTPSPPPPREPEPEPEPEPEEVPFSEKDLPPLRFEEEKPPTADDLPPWAERVKDGVTPGFRSATEDEFSRDFGDFNADEEPAPAAEPGGLEFGEEGLRRQAEAGPRPRRRRRRLNAGSRVKARLYDVLMITLLWAAALWASARVLGVSLFDIVLNSAAQVGIFYLILLAGYFALFFSFLGETLGDRLGSPPA
jgi:hypothetical protein